MCCRPAETPKHVYPQQQEQVLEMKGTREPEEEPRARSDASTQAQYFGPLQCPLCCTKAPPLAEPAPEPACTEGWRRAPNFCY